VSGNTWNPIPAFVQACVAGKGSGHIIVNADHGWVCAEGSGLWCNSYGIDRKRVGS
jgi:hypothetical protein